MPVMTTVLFQFPERQVQCDKGKVSNGGETGGICWNVVPEMDPGWGGCAGCLGGSQPVALG